MAIVEKPNGNVQICLDPRHLNKAIKWDHFQLPTNEDIQQEWPIPNGLSS